MRCSVSTRRADRTADFADMMDGHDEGLDRPGAPGINSQRKGCRGRCHDGFSREGNDTVADDFNDQPPTSNMACWRVFIMTLRHYEGVMEGLQGHYWDAVLKLTDGCLGRPVAITYR